MALNDYHILSRWRVPGNVEDVFAILSNPADYPRWWSDVFLEVEVSPVAPVATIRSQGRLPYQLHWQARAVEAGPPYGFTVEVTGDFSGRGVWQFEPDGEHVNITFDWAITARKPLLRYLAFLLRPAFVASHAWAMRRGEEGLRQELARRERQRRHALTRPRSAPPREAVPAGRSGN
jgi:hypothetical protein